MVKCVLLSFLLMGVSEEEVQKSTVKITHIYEQKKNNETSRIFYNGSGTIIKKTDTYFDVLTCDHVLEGNKKVTVDIWDKTKYEAFILNRDKEKDLALLRVFKKANICEAPIADNEDYSIKTVFYKSGYGSGNVAVVKKGACLGIFRKANGSDLFSFLGTVPGYSGDSGGGIHRTSDGRLIGVLWGSRDDTLRARMIPEIREFLRNSNWK